MTKLKIWLQTFFNELLAKADEVNGDDDWVV